MDEGALKAAFGIFGFEAGTVERQRDVGGALIAGNKRCHQMF